MRIRSKSTFSAQSTDFDPVVELARLNQTYVLHKQQFFTPLKPLNKMNSENDKTDFREELMNKQLNFYQQYQRKRFEAVKSVFSPVNSDIQYYGSIMQNRLQLNRESRMKK
ncbi:Hypothetical_protein [Hexamita inflata]|uniref:Hypothetical_protein n=1 Tax=Hexamita inflata TaxID=28002 RepID=A0AA86RAQ5_9EUKA|nr:Hypothetical protein HINF_LOCUS62614 [Hexamita inflata]